MNKIRVAYRRVLGFFTRHSILFCFLLACFVNLIVEIFSREFTSSIIDHLFKSPEVFLYNSAVIFTVFLLCFCFRRRAFVLSLLAAPFLTLGIINFAVLCYRVTPISATDFVKIRSIFGIFDIYLEGWVIVAVAAAIALAVFGYVMIYKHTIVRPCRPLIAATGIPAFIVVLAIFSNFLIQNGSLSKKFTNLNDAYSDYGFVYCFFCSVFDTGIEKPQDYSPEKVKSILEEIRAEETNTPEKTPNVIFVQLESFFDVNEIKSLKYNKNPIPTFSALKKNFPGGYLEVPYIGSGTANVEFEVMTGMSLEFFGPGEYPYKTVLQKRACESIAFNLKELGYTAHAIHNHKGSFYDRAHVFSSLGYDTFTSLEFMTDMSYNPIGWADDKPLTSEIITALDSTDGDDFVYAITVQTHGVYSEEYLDDVRYDYSVTVTDPDTEVNKISFEYYLTQMKATDDFIRELIVALSERDEDTVVVFFGDHLPYFGLRDEEMENGNVYQTEYVIWSNYGLEAEGKDLYSYELSAHVLKQLGINNGLLTKLHQNSEHDEHYKKNLEMLQYDMLYAPKDEEEYMPSELQMGVKPLKITDIKSTERGLEITGEMFTEFTRVVVNGKKYEVIFYNDNTLIALDADVVYGDSVSVVQTNGKRTVFAESEPVIVGEDIQVEPWE